MPTATRDLAAVLDAFGLGTPTAAATEAARGEAGRIYRAETATDTWAVKELFHPENAGNVDLQISFMRAATEAGVRVPRVVPSPAGTILVELDGVCWRAFEWIDIASVPSPGEAGAALAALHRAGWSSDEPVDPWFTHRTVGGSWERLAGLSRGESWEALLRERLPALPALDRLTDNVPLPPCTICHRDFIEDNVVADRQRNVVVLDWDNCGPLPPEREVACALAMQPSLSHAGSFIDGYRAAGGTFNPRGLDAFATAAAVTGNYLALTIERAVDGDDRARAAVQRRIATTPSADHFRLLLELLRA